MANLFDENINVKMFPLLKKPYIVNTNITKCIGYTEFNNDKEKEMYNFFYLRLKKKPFTLEEWELVISVIESRIKNM